MNMRFIELTLFFLRAKFCACWFKHKKSCKQQMTNCMVRFLRHSVVRQSLNYYRPNLALYTT